MRVRHPPGRAGRPWLARRLEVARRGAELLDEKCRALSHERRRLEPLVAQARRSWVHAARAAERSLARAAVLGGQPQVELARATSGAAQLDVRWHTVLGVRCPRDVEVVPPDPRSVAPGGSAALHTAADTHREAFEAAAALAVLEAALRRIEDELRATTLRRNAIEHRWIPAHEAAAAQLALTLEELEREDATRVRWAGQGQRQAAPQVPRRSPTG
ncbi:MAG TPA: V-type ATP synthase subunit D [Solirubrobacteraceae bacterium]|nr:V-type ATP synthase subunit D [Solirubrobacteraceae bacterium]